MKMKIPVYEDGVIAVALIAEKEVDAEKYLFSLALRYQPPEVSFKDGTAITPTNKMDGETDWFILPHSFGTAIGKRLVEQKYRGLFGRI